MLSSLTPSSKHLAVEVIGNLLLSSIYVLVIALDVHEVCYDMELFHEELSSASM